MILLSNAGSNIQVADRASDTIVVGVLVNGVAILERVDGTAGRSARAAAC